MGKLYEYLDLWPSWFVYYYFFLLDQGTEKVKTICFKLYSVKLWFTGLKNHSSYVT